MEIGPEKVLQILTEFQQNNSPKIETNRTKQMNNEDLHVSVLL